MYSKKKLCTAYVKHSVVYKEEKLVTNTKKINKQKTKVDFSKCSAERYPLRIGFEMDVAPWTLQHDLN